MPSPPPTRTDPKEGLRELLAGIIAEPTTPAAPPASDSEAAAHAHAARRIIAYRPTTLKRALAWISGALGLFFIIAALLGFSTYGGADAWWNFAAGIVIATSLALPGAYWTWRTVRDSRYVATWARDVEAFTGNWQWLAENEPTLLFDATPARLPHLCADATGCWYLSWRSCYSSLGGCWALTCPWLPNWWHGDWAVAQSVPAPPGTPPFTTLRPPSLLILAPTPGLFFLAPRLAQLELGMQRLPGSAGHRAVALGIESTVQPLRVALSGGLNLAGNRHSGARSFHQLRAIAQKPLIKLWLRGLGAEDHAAGAQARGIGNFIDATPKVAIKKHGKLSRHVVSRYAKADLTTPDSPPCRVQRRMPPCEPSSGLPTGPCDSRIRIMNVPQCTHPDHAT